MRITLATIGTLSAFFMHPAVTLLCMMVLSVRYTAWEVLLIGFLVDCLWFSPANGSFGSIPLFTVSAFILVWGLEPLRKEFLTE